MKTRHLLQLIALSALWGASFLFIRIASPLLGPTVIAGLRIVLATLTLMALMGALRHRWAWQHWRELTGLGLLSVALPGLLFAWAALRLPAGYSALLNSSSVLFGALAAAWLGEDSLNLRKLVGCAIGLFGVGLIVHLGPVPVDAATLLAAGACVAGAACYGLATPLLKRATTRMQPLAIAAGLHLGALPFLLPGAAWGWPQAVFTGPAVLALLAMGIGTSGLVYWMHLRLLRHISPVAAMSPAFMIPVFGVAWGHLFLGEALSPSLVLGGACVLLATALVTGFSPWRRPVGANTVP